jgi:hypothetical protein
MDGRALSLDVWDEARREKVERLQWQLAQQLLPLGLTVIIEWGTWGRSERDALRLGARELGAAVELHYLSAPPHALLDRMQRRGQENPPISREHLWALGAGIPSTHGGKASIIRPGDHGGNRSGVFLRVPGRRTVERREGRSGC